MSCRIIFSVSLCLRVCVTNVPSTTYYVFAHQFIYSSINDVHIYITSDYHQFVFTLRSKSRNGRECSNVCLPCVKDRRAVWVTCTYVCILTNLCRCDRWSFFKWVLRYLWRQEYDPYSVGDMPSIAFNMCPNFNVAVVASWDLAMEWKNWQLSFMSDRGVVRTSERCCLRMSFCLRAPTFFLCVVAILCYRGRWKLLPNPPALCMCNMTMSVCSTS